MFEGCVEFRDRTRYRNIQMSWVKYLFYFWTGYCNSPKRRFVDAVKADIKSASVERRGCR